MKCSVTSLVCVTTEKQNRTGELFFFFFKDHSKQPTILPPKFRMQTVNVEELKINGTNRINE